MFSFFFVALAMHWILQFKNVFGVEFYVVWNNSNSGHPKILVLKKI